MEDTYLPKRGHGRSTGCADLRNVFWREFEFEDAGVGLILHPDADSVVTEGQRCGEGAAAHWDLAIGQQDRGKGWNALVNAGRRLGVDCVPMHRVGTKAHHRSGSRG